MDQKVRRVARAIVNCGNVGVEQWCLLITFLVIFKSYQHSKWGLMKPLHLTVTNQMVRYSSKLHDSCERSFTML